MKFFNPSLPLCLTAIVALPLASAPAFAHATLEKAESAANAPYRAAVKISHGCKGSATTAVRVQIPEGVIGVKPMPKAGWTLETVKGVYARSYKTYHEPATSGVKEIVWSKGLLPDDYYDEFIFSAFVSDAFTPGDKVYFPVTQECVEGFNRWTEIPAAGQNPRDLKEPAPVLRIVASVARANAPSQTVMQIGDLQIENPWIRATPGGAKVAGGFLRIANKGKQADRLIGAGISLAARGEVHEMSATDGVMHMRALPNGLEIAPDALVELKPGGNHLMFLDLTGPLTEGQEVAGTLTFEKAGKIPVQFRIGGFGAASGVQQQSGGDHQH